MPNTTTEFQGSSKHCQGLKPVLLSPTQNSLPLTLSSFLASSLSPLRLHTRLLRTFLAWKMSVSGEPPLATPSCSSPLPHTCSSDHLHPYLHLSIHLSLCPLKIRPVFLYTTETGLLASRPRGLSHSLSSLTFLTPFPFPLGTTQVFV